MRSRGLTMGYFEDIDAFERRKTEQQEKAKKLQAEKKEFINAVIPKVIDILREFASKAPDMVPQKFVVTPTHHRRYSFFEGTTTYRPVIEMPDVMQIRFGVSLERLENEPNYWNEIYLDKSGRYHCCESVVVPNGDEPPQTYRIYKGFAYERNLAKTILDACVAKNEWLNIDYFIEFLIDTLEAYLADGRADISYLQRLCV